MLAEARKRLDGVRLEQATAEHLPFAGASFDLVVSAMSFDHWADQELGLAECSAPWLLPTCRTPRRAAALLTRAGFRDLTWRRMYELGPLPLVQAALAAR